MPTPNRIPPTPAIHDAGSKNELTTEKAAPMSKPDGIQRPNSQDRPQKGAKKQQAPTPEGRNTDHNAHYDIDGQTQDDQFNVVLASDGHNKKDDSKKSKSR